MATADEQIRVTDRVKRDRNRLRREGESYNDVLERLLDEERVGDFYDGFDGFGRWSDEEAERVRKGRRKSKQKRKERMRERIEDTA